MTIRLAVFDCDGTLIDGQASICAAMERAFSECDLPLPPRNRVRRAVGLSLPQAIRTLIPEAEAEQHLAVTDAYKRAFRAARQSGTLQQPLYAGIAALLDDLRAQGWLLGVATGMSRRGLDHCLATHGLSGHFITLQTADDHPSKPHPAMLKAALLDAAADPQDAVMIGDTVFDMQMACDAGVRAIGVDWGYHPSHELLAAGAKSVATSPMELGEILRR
jgi:phosphoglycolate phosphatase